MKKAGKIYHKTNQLSSTGYEAKTETSDSSDPEAILLASSKADEEAGQTQIVSFSCSCKYFCKLKTK